MTIITVNAPTGRIVRDARAALAETLTDAVLVPEIGQNVPAARVGFQVLFREYDPDMMAVGGKLVADTGADAMVIDIAVMEGDWPDETRAEVIRNTLGALADALSLADPSPSWWVTFRVIEEGSWGSRGDVLSIHDLLGTGVFSDAKAKAISANVKKLG